MRSPSIVTSPSSMVPSSRSSVMTRPPTIRSRTGLGMRDSLRRSKQRQERLQLVAGSRSEQGKVDTGAAIAVDPFENLLRRAACGETLQIGDGYARRQRLLASRLVRLDEHGKVFRLYMRLTHRQPGARIEGQLARTELSGNLPADRLKGAGPVVLNRAVDKLRDLESFPVPPCLFHGRPKDPDGVGRIFR